MAEPHPNKLSQAVSDFISLVDENLRTQQFTLGFAAARAGIHHHGVTSEPLKKRYLLMLENVTKSKAVPAKSNAHPPKVVHLRDLLLELPADLTGKLTELAGDEAMQPGDKCVLFKERHLMVVGMLNAEWRVLLETYGNDRVQFISGLEEAVVRGLSQVEAEPEMPAELKEAWNSWALKLCETENGGPQLRTKCLIQKTVLLLNQQHYTKALESAQAVLKLTPDCKHAMALLATAQHKTGKKKPASDTLRDLTEEFLKADGDVAVSEDFGHPLELTIALLVEMHRTKDALKLLGQLLMRVTSARQQPLFFAIARLYAKVRAAPSPPRDAAAAGSV